MKAGSIMQGKLYPFMVFSLFPTNKTTETSISVNQLNIADILNFITKPEQFVMLVKKNDILEIKEDLAEIACRLNELYQNDKEISMFPDHAPLLEKIIWPLKNAKACYIVGNYLGTISLCGIIAEMITVMFYEIKKPDKIKSKYINQDLWKLINNNREFDKMYQDQRIKVLRAFRVISEEECKNLNTIKDIRNDYLHLFSKKNLNIRSDAKKCYDKTYQLLLDVTGYKKHPDGSYSFEKSFEEYLIKLGHIKKPKRKKNSLTLPSPVQITGEEKSIASQS